MYPPGACVLLELCFASEIFEIFIDICDDDPQYLGSVVLLVQCMRVAGTKWAKFKNLRHSREKVPEKEADTMPMKKKAAKKAAKKKKK